MGLSRAGQKQSGAEPLRRLRFSARVRGREEKNMGKFTGVLLASDFDRSLTGPDDKIPARNIEAVRWFKEQGGEFAVVTGRSHSLFRARLGDIPKGTPVIVMNGALIYDFEAGRAIFERDMDDDVKDLVRWIQAQWPGVRFELQTIRGHYAFGEDPARDEFMRMNRCELLRAPLEEIDVPVMKIAIFGDWSAKSFENDMFAALSPEDDAYYEDMKDRLNEHCGGKYVAVRSMPRTVEVQAAGESKGTAVRRLADSLGCGFIAAVGDAPNDIPLLDAANMPFVPSTASPDLLEDGRYCVVGPCGGGAVADAVYAMESLL